MTYSPNPLRHNPDPAGSLYCMICMVPCTEARPCPCDAEPAAPETVPDEAPPAKVRPAAPEVRMVSDSDEGVSGETTG